MRRRSATGPLLALASLASACGRPATEDECRTIAERLVELECKAQHVTDPTEIASRQAAALDAGVEGRRSLYEGCVGRRITDGAMACIRAAQTADEITDKCLR